MLRPNGIKEGFLVLSTQVPNVNKASAGLCPHGLPPSACPICSNMGGGGSMRVGERPQKAGEMSYHQCAMIGNMMRARELAEKRHAQNLEQHAENLKAFEANMQKLSANMLEFAKLISNNFLLKPIAFTIQNIAVPFVKFVSSIPKITANIAANIAEKINLIKEKFIDIMDKLTAVFGEAKAFIEKKISELVSVIKTKFEGLFKIFKKHNAEDDDTKIDDDKKIFNLKTILHKISTKLKWKNKNDNERSSQN